MDQDEMIQSIMNHVKINKEKIASDAVNTDKLRPLAGWEGPASLDDGVYRYSKYFSWMRIFIDVVIESSEKDGNEKSDEDVDECRDEGIGNGRNYDFYGGCMGSGRDFEVRRENGRWIIYDADIAWTPGNEPVITLRGSFTWDLVYEHKSNGIPLDEKIETLQDLAVYLESHIQNAP